MTQSLPGNGKLIQILLDTTESSPYFFFFKDIFSILYISSAYMSSVSVAGGQDGQEGAAAVELIGPFGMLSVNRRRRLRHKTFSCTGRAVLPRTNAVEAFRTCTDIGDHSFPAPGLKYAQSFGKVPGSAAPLPRGSRPCRRRRTTHHAAHHSQS